MTSLLFGADGSERSNQSRVVTLKFCTLVWNLQQSADYLAQDYTIWALKLAKALSVSVGIEIEVLGLSDHVESEVDADCSSTGGQYGSP